MADSPGALRTPGGASDDGGPPQLHCCQGQRAPEAVVRGWDRLCGLSSGAQQRFFELLTNSVAESDEAALASAMSGFCAMHGVTEDQAFTTLKACQFLLQQAAALDLDADRFVEDLQKLSGDHTGALRLMATRYGPLKERVREGLFVQSLTDHGKVLADLSWRVDQVSASDRGANLTAPVVYLTLHLQDGDGEERVTMQLTGQSIQRLQQFCQRFSEG